ncbi:MAG: LacI family DNA-binding transcriptional regulator [Granulosicoccaceae bacterium]
MSKVVTLKEVAKLAGVSRSAVSRSFTDGASVSAKTREKVHAVAQELGYQPNALASSLTTGRTKLIGLVSNNFHNPVFLEVFDLFTRSLQDRGLRPLLVNLSDETDPDSTLQMLQQYSVDGVIIASSTLPPSFAQAFHDAGMPVVHSFARANQSPDVCIAGVDNIQCGRIAAHTLMQRGYTDVAFLGGPASATSTQDRLSGFLETLSTHTQVKVGHSFAAAYAFEAGRDAMQTQLSGTPAQAYFCGDDVLSIGALSAIQSAGLTVPDDIGLIGFNDMEMAGWQNINLTTIRQPVKDIIASSVDLITSLLNEPARAVEARLFACHIIERGTLKPIIVVPEQ